MSSSHSIAQKEISQTPAQLARRIKTFPLMFFINQSLLTRLTLWLYCQSFETLHYLMVMRLIKIFLSPLFLYSPPPVISEREPQWKKFTLRVCGWGESPFNEMQILLSFQIVSEHPKALVQSARYDQSVTQLNSKSTVYTHSHSNSLAHNFCYDYENDIEWNCERVSWVVGY